jgi:hypothetical protein
MIGRLSSITPSSSIASFSRGTSSWTYTYIGTARILLLVNYWPEYRHECGDFSSLVPQPTG